MTTYPRQNIKTNYFKALESEEMWGDPGRESKLEGQVCTKFLVFTFHFFSREQATVVSKTPVENL